MNGYESSDTASDTDEWEESLETGEYLSDEEWIPESHLMPVIWYNPFQQQGSWSDDDEAQEATQNPVKTAQTNAVVDPNQVEPQGADEEKDLAPMPDLEEYARILQRLAIEQEQDRINQLHQNPEPEVPENLQASPPVTPENEKSCWIDDPLTSEDESDSQRFIMEASSIKVACNVIVQDYNASEAPSAEATDSQNVSGSISSGATYSRVTSTQIAPSQPSSPETVTSEFKPLPTDHHEEALADEVFKENPVNWSQVPNLIGDVWTDEILDKEEKLLEAVQDLFPENAPCNAITEDGNAAIEAFSVNQEDQPLEPEGGLPKEEPPLEAFEVGKGTRSGLDYHKNYNQPSSSSYVNPSGKQAVNAPSGGDNENAGLKEAFNLISELQRLNLDVDKHAPQVLQIEMDYRVTKSRTSSKGEKKEAGGPCTECLSVQKAASATIAFNKEDLLLGETKHNRPLYFTGKEDKAKDRGKFAVSFVSTIQDSDSDSETEDDTSSSQADTQQVRPALTPLESPADVEDPASATFVVPETSAEEKPIFFHRSDTSSSNCLLEPFQNEGMPQLSLYSPMAQAIMKKMGYDAQNPIGLGGGRGILTPLEPTLTKSQLKDWKLHRRIHKSSYGLGYDLDTPMRQLTQRLQSRFANQASTSHVNEDIDLPGYLFEELPNKDPGSSSNWCDFSDDEEELSDDTDARFSDLEEPSSPKEVPYFDPVSAGDWDHLIASLEKNTDQEDLWTETEPWSENALGNPEGLVELEASENIVEEPPSNLPTEDSVQKIDLGTPDNPLPVFISKNIKDEELSEYVSFLREFGDCFAWSYTEMPGLDPKIAVHKLNMQENVRPVKQGQRRFRPDVMDKIEQEVQKLKNVGFIRKEQHPEWLANIVPVTKKNGQIRFCIDYRDLNNACPKDELPLPIPEVMIDNTYGFE
ncbi:hypothetical protein AAC387_Pa12g0394 [Persea americana]